MRNKSKGVCHVNVSLLEITPGQRSMTRQERHVIRSSFIKPTIHIFNLMTQHKDLFISLLCKKSPFLILVMTQNIYI